MSNLYRITVRIYATAYIKADSSAEAARIARAEFNNQLMTVNDCDPGLVDDSPFDSEDLPDYSLSPAMTLHGPEGVAELVEE